MNKREFKSKLMLIGINQGEYARIIRVTDNTITNTLKTDRIPVLWRLAIEALATYSEEQIDQLIGVDSDE